MSQTFYLSDEAIGALKNGEYLVLRIDSADIDCKIEKYDIEEQVKDEFEFEEIVFEPDIRRKNEK